MRLTWQICLITSKTHGWDNEWWMRNLYVLLFCYNENGDMFSSTKLLKVKMLKWSFFSFVVQCCRSIYRRTLIKPLHELPKFVGYACYAEQAWKRLKLLPTLNMQLEMMHRLWIRESKWKFGSLKNWAYCTLAFDISVCLNIWTCTRCAVLCCSVHYFPRLLTNILVSTT